MLNRRKIQLIRRTREKLCAFYRQEIFKSPCTIQMRIVSLKKAPRMPWMKGTILSCSISMMYLLFFDCLQFVAAAIFHDISQEENSSYSCTVNFDIPLGKITFTHVAYGKRCHKIKWLYVREKTHWLLSVRRLSWVHFIYRCRSSSKKLILYEEVLTHCPRCKKEDDERRKKKRECDTPIAVDQFSANCLYEVALSAKTYGSRFYHLALNKFRNLHTDFQIAFLFFGPLLSNFHQSTTVTMHKRWYCSVGISSFTISNDSAPFILRQ